MTIQIIHANALDLTFDIFAACDVQITDFPYSAHVHENATSVGNALDVAPGHSGMGAHSRDLGFASLSPELRRRGMDAACFVRRWSIVFSDFEGAHDWIVDSTAANVEYIRTVPWVRWSQPQLSGDRPCSGAEAVLCFHSQLVGPRGGIKPLSKHWNGPGSLTHFNRRCLRGKDKHPTEKPIDLMLDLVSWFSDPGETVLDLCSGSGTTALACRLLDRNCLAVELDENWVNRSRQRIESPLTIRDFARAEEWIHSVVEEASRVPVPKAKDGSDVKTFERAQRRKDDVKRVAEKLIKVAA